VEIPSVFRLINTGIQILVCEIRIFGVQQDDKFEIGAMCHLINDSLEGLCHYGHCNHHEWLMGLYKCWMSMRWCGLYLQQMAGHRIQSLEQIPLTFFTNNDWKVIGCLNDLFFKGIPP